MKVTDLETRWLYDDGRQKFSTSREDHDVHRRRCPSSLAPSPYGSRSRSLIRSQSQLSRASRGTHDHVKTHNFSGRPRHVWRRRHCTSIRLRCRGLLAQNVFSTSSCMFGGEIADDVVRAVGDRATASERQDNDVMRRGAKGDIQTAVTFVWWAERLHTACGGRVRTAGSDGREFTEKYPPKLDFAGVWSGAFLWDLRDLEATKIGKQ